MVDIANFRFDDIGERFDRGFGRGLAIQQRGARVRAGNALQRSDERGAASELYGAGMLEEGRLIDRRIEERAASQATAAKARQDELLKFTGEAAGRLADFHRQSKDINRTLAAFDQLAPRFAQYGETPEDIAELRASIQKDPDGTLMALGAGAAKERGLEFRSSGDEVFVFEPGNPNPVARYRGAKTVSASPETDILEIPGEYGSAGGSGPAEPPAEREAAAPARVASVDEMKSALGRVLGSGATYTSGYRTPERNREVGGVDNSYHTRGSGQALDIVPPQGMTTAEAAEKIKASGRYAEVIDEGDHVHVAWEGEAPRVQTRQPQGPRVIRAGRPKVEPRVRPATAAEKAAYGIAPDVPAQIKPDGSIDVVGGQGMASDRKAETDLRKEFNMRPEVKEYREVANSFRTIQNLANSPPSPAGDISLIFAYMKMLDPTSVVREGEQAQAQNAAGVPDVVRNLYNRALTGQRLNPKQRQDFLTQAGRVHQTRQRRYGELVQEYRGYAQGYGVDPERISPVATPPAGGGGNGAKVIRYDAQGRRIK